MAHWKNTKNAKGWVTRAEAKEDGRFALREQDRVMIREGLADIESQD